MNPIEAVQFLFFSFFGQTTPDNLQKKTNAQPLWTIYLFKFVFGIYLLVSMILINLLIAMMSDTYQRIQAQSDIEWKYGRAKLIRNMHRTTTTPSPLNLVMTWLMYFIHLCKKKMAQRKKPSMVQLLGLQKKSKMSPRSKMAAKWLARVKKGTLVPEEPAALSVVQLNPSGSQLSFSNLATRIQNAADWDAVAKKYRSLMGEGGEDGVAAIESSSNSIAGSESTLPAS